VGRWRCHRRLRDDAAMRDEAAVDARLGTPIVGSQALKGPHRGATRRWGVHPSVGMHTSEGGQQQRCWLSLVARWRDAVEAEGKGENEG
jgi:hypothetical protein